MLPVQPQEPGQKHGSDESWTGYACMLHEPSLNCNCGSRTYLSQPPTTTSNNTSQPRHKFVSTLEYRRRVLVAPTVEACHGTLKFAPCFLCRKCCMVWCVICTCTMCFIFQYVGQFACRIFLLSLRSPLNWGDLALCTTHPPFPPSPALDSSPPLFEDNIAVKHCNRC